MCERKGISVKCTHSALVALLLLVEALSILKSHPHHLESQFRELKGTI